MKLLVCAKTVLAPANKQSTMNSAPTKCCRAAFPLPLGEGQGEGAQLREKGKKNVEVVRVRAKPSPQPSPKGRGRFLFCNLFIIFLTPDPENVSGSAARCAVAAMPHRNISFQFNRAAPRIWGIAPKSTRASSRKVRDLPHISRHSRKTNQLSIQSAVAASLCRRTPNHGTLKPFSGFP